jgi:clathrin heavy chain
LDTKAKVKQADIPEAIVYWRWISLNKIGIVGKTAIYHLDITNQDPAVRVFER